MKLPEIYPVACHTDNVGPRSTFVAIKGMKADGVDYISLALQKGAQKIVVQDSVQLSPELLQKIEQHHAELIYVKNSRRALAQLSAQALDYPAKKLRIIGVTGTKGKTTTCFLLWHMLSVAGYKTALLSTVHNVIDTITFKTSLTTQQPDYVHAFFDQCVKNNIEWVVMEVAAQAISLDRVYGVEFDGAVFTNFDLEHLEFYATMEDYFAAKCALFDQVKLNAPILINADDIWCQKIVRMSTIETFGLSPSADIQGKIDVNTVSGLRIHIGKVHYYCPQLFGEFNAYNLIAAIGMAMRIGLSSKVIEKGLLTFAGVPGRLQIYSLPNGSFACIDKAHNPSSFKAILGTLRLMTDHLIVVFGAGGERDKSKRPLMGQIATQFCDVVIITSDDPRSEDPQQIIEDIFIGIDQQFQSKVFKEIDRELAIKKAYNYSRKGSMIALLGKGPEEYQLINGTKYYFSEREILKSL